MCRIREFLELAGALDLVLGIWWRVLSTTLWENLLRTFLSIGAGHLGEGTGEAREVPEEKELGVPKTATLLNPSEHDPKAQSQTKLCNVVFGPREHKK